MKALEELFEGLSNTWKDKLLFHKIYITYTVFTSLNLQLKGLEVAPIANAGIRIKILGPDNFREALILKMNDESLPLISRFKLPKKL